MLFAMSSFGLFLANPSQASALTIDSQDGKSIYFVYAPFVTWDDISEQTTPNLYSILDQSALGNAIARSPWRLGGQTVSANEVAADINRGAWTDDEISMVSNSVRDLPNEEGADATAILAEAGKLGSEKVSNLNYTLWGTMTDQLHLAGWSTVALGSSDLGNAPQRPAAALTADSNGIVQYANTQPGSILTDNVRYPYGLQTNLDAFDKWFYKAQSQVKGNAFYALDPGDLFRAGSYRLANPNTDSSEYWNQALASFDHVVGLAIQNMSEGDTLIVFCPLSMVSQADHQDDGYAPMIVYGNGYSGMIGSNSMHRQDLTSALDVTSTVLDLAGIDYYLDNSSPIVTSQNPQYPNGSKLVYQLAKEASYADAISDGQNPMNAVFITFIAIAFAASVMMISPRIKLSVRMLEFFIPATRLLLLFVCSFPLASYLMILVEPDRSTPFMLICICTTIAALVTIAVLVIGKYTKWVYSFITLLLITVIVLAVDQLTGGNLARIGFLSYKPITASRYTGMGNEGATILFVCWIMLSGMMLNRFPDLKISVIFKNWLFLVLSVCLIAIIVLPFWGGQFGALVWGTLGMFCTWWVFKGHRLTWKVVLSVIGAMVVLMCALVLVDGMGGQSHLGATASDLLTQGPSYLLIIARNIFIMNWATVVYSPAGTVCLIAFWIWLARIRIKKPGPYKVFWDRNYYFKSSFTAVMITSVLVLIIEDSGILLPALIILYSTSALTWLVCDLHRWELRSVERNKGIIAEDVEKPVGSFKVGEASEKTAIENDAAETFEEEEEGADD